MRKNYLKWGLILMVSLVLVTPIGADDGRPKAKVIENPKPNLVEKKYRKLTRVGEIPEDLGNGEYLFDAYSVAMDKAGSLFIYDILQAKIYKFDKNLKFIKSFGGKGRGPGEFSGTGVTHMVFLSMGLDGRLYANDCRAFKVMTFSTDGKYIRDINYAVLKDGTMNHPVVGADGLLVYQIFKDDRLMVMNETGKCLFSIENKDKAKEYLFYIPKIDPKFEKYSRLFKRPFGYSDHELKMRFISDSRLLLFFASSSRLYVLDNHKLFLKKNIRPKTALEEHEKRIGNNEIGFWPLFNKFFVDGDEPGVFYLQFGETMDKKKNCLYKMNVKGELLGVLYLDLEDETEPKYPKFLLKQGGLFFTKERETLAFYKEEK